SSNINTKSHNLTIRSYIPVDETGISDTNNTQKWLPDKTSSSTTIHPEGSIIHHSDCVVSNRSFNESLEALGKSLLDRAGLMGCATVFLMLDGPHVRYYLANHSTKTIMWIGADNLPSAILAVGPQREQNMLYEEYWTHMENFPAPVPAAIEDSRQLKAVLVSLAVGVYLEALILEQCVLTFCLEDSNTSDGSTSPFTSAQIQEFLTMLNTFSSQVEMFQTYTIGRIAYVSEWRRFKLKNEQEWNQVMYLACVLIISSLLVRGRGTIQFASNIAITLTCASAAISYCLVNESRNLGEQAADASVHFQCWETAQYGIQGLAIRNAAPRAFLVWGFMAFILSLF
ncbi:hypothetical protein FRC07_007061, partial [Ceratobasidium sp. 392]